MQFSEILTTIRDALVGASPTLDTTTDPAGTSGHYIGLRNDHSLRRVPGPPRQRRTHAFHSLDGFAAWVGVNVEKPIELEVLVAPDFTAKAINGGRDPRADELSIALPTHPTFEALDALLGKAIDQRTFHHFVRAHRDAIAGSDVLLGELRKIAIKRGADFSSEIDESGRTVFSAGAERVDLNGKLPAEITVRTPFRVGVIGNVDAGPLTQDGAATSSGTPSAYDLEVLVEMDTSGAAVAFRLSCPAIYLALQVARGDLRDHLDRILPDETIVGLGTLGSEAIDPGTPEFVTFKAQLE